jgi:hypothetical protein
MKKIICILLCFTFCFGIFSDPIYNINTDVALLNHNLNYDLPSQFFDTNEKTIETLSLIENQNIRRNNDRTPRFSINGLYRNVQREIVPLQSSSGYMDDTTLIISLVGILVAFIIVGVVLLVD